jgi:flagellar hook-basal body complex protein FliE
MVARRRQNFSARKPANTRLIVPFAAPGGAYSAAHVKRPPNPQQTAMNDLRVKPFDFQAAVARAGLRPDGTPRTGGATGAEGVAGGFRTAMADALKDVSRTQFEASRLQREVTLDNPAVSVEETMVAMQKAQIGFQATIQVRNRLVQAYSDIMNMQV